MMPYLDINFLSLLRRVSHQVSLNRWAITLLCQTDATIVFITSQISNVLEYSISRNMRIARDRAWDQTVESRGKGPEFWQPYVEEWKQPPQLASHTWDKWVGGWFGRFLLRKVITVPLNFYPFVGIAVSAYIKAVGTARYLHKPVSIVSLRVPSCDVCIVSISKRKRWLPIRLPHSWKSEDGTTQVWSQFWKTSAWLIIYISIWICCCITREHPDLRSLIQHLQSCRSCHVGSWYAFVEFKYWSVDSSFV